METARLLLFAAVILTASCASDDPLVKRAVSDSHGVPAATVACCQSLVEAIGSPPALATAATNLSPEAPHFDFGEGLSPYRVYALEPQFRAIEVHAPLQLKGWAHGGDGRGRHLHVVARFYSAEGTELRQTADRRVVKYLGNGYRALFHYLQIPAGARTVVFSTDTRQKDIEVTVPMENMPSTVGIVGGVPIFLPASRSSTFLSANHGPVQFRTLQAFPAQPP